jgi:hypothetical protein
MNFTPHYYLEWGGDFVSEPLEIWSNGIRLTEDTNLDGSSFPSTDEGGTAEMLAHYSDKVIAHFGTAAAGYGSNVRLKYIKFNEVLPNGKRKNQGFTWRRDIAGVGTPGTNASVGPITHSMVVTFLTDVMRGRASKGRIFVPHPSLTITSANKFRYDPTVVPSVVTTWTAFLNSLADAPGLDTPNSLVPSVLSGLETPALYRNILRCQVGDHPDYMGSRRNRTKEVRTTGAFITQ